MRKTLKLIEETQKLLEQDEQNIDVAEAGGASESSKALTTEGEIYLTRLAAMAFTYTPDAEEINIVNELVKQYGQSQPKMVTDQIQNIIQVSNQSFEQELADV